MFQFLIGKEGWFVGSISARIPCSYCPIITNKETYISQTQWRSEPSECSRCRWFEISWFQNRIEVTYLWEPSCEPLPFGGWSVCQVSWPGRYMSGPYPTIQWCRPSFCSYDVAQSRNGFPCSRSENKIDKILSKKLPLRLFSRHLSCDLLGHRRSPTLS